MSCPITVIGECREKVQLLVHYLQNYEHLCLKSSLDGNEAPEKVSEGIIPSPESQRDTKSKSPVLSIKTKYYTAELGMSLNVTSEDDEISLDGGCECCILVASSQENAIHSSIAKIGSNAHQSKVDIKVLVVFKEDEDNYHVENFRGDRVLWALDNSFEYIEISTSSPTEGYDIREKDGLPRLMEALHTNMWSSMERSDPAAAVASQKNGEVTSLPGSVFSMPLLSATSNKASSGENEDCGDEKDEVENKQSKLGYKGLLDEKDDDDRVWDNFNSTIEAAKQLREESLGGKISDDTRRTRAAELAMKMCAMMNLGEDDSSDEDN